MGAGRQQRKQRFHHTSHTIGHRSDGGFGQECTNATIAQANTGKGSCDDAKEQEHTNANATVA
jgi:hypothetical protein